MRKLQLIIICSAAIMAITACKRASLSNTATIHNGKYCYRGETKNGKQDGYGVLTLGDSVVYSGQWKDGKRSGESIVTDSLGRSIIATWNADTIVSGTRRDSTGTYQGSFNNKFEAEGHGIWKGTDGTFYSGQWTSDKRSGFGCGVAPGGKVKVGDWRADKYRGERMLHTSDRIYGIDVSRYQHEAGRKKYAINWAEARITGLGSGNKGNGTYQISFAYIKSTEGTTVKNKYFASDYRNARRQGIAVGAYHFFSTKSNAAAQAHFFLKNSILRNGDMPPVLDVEPSNEQIKKMGGAEALFRCIRTWLAIVGRATGTKPVLYVGQGFVNKYLPQAPDIKNNYPIWIARYGQYRPDITLAFWQLTPYGRVRGIHGEVDINVFNGYHEQFNEFLRRETIRR